MVNSQMYWVYVVAILLVLWFCLGQGKEGFSESANCCCKSCGPTGCNFTREGKNWCNSSNWGTTAQCVDDDNCSECCCYVNGRKYPPNKVTKGICNMMGRCGKC